MSLSKRLSLKLKRTWYGKRSKGTPVPGPSKKTTQVVSKPDFTTWCQEFRVSSKFNLDQAVYF